VVVANARHRGDESRATHGALLPSAASVGGIGVTVGATQPQRLNDRRFRLGGDGSGDWWWSSCLNRQSLFWREIILKCFA